MREAGAMERRLSRLDRPLIVAVLLTGLVIAAFAPWWHSGRVLAPLDILNELYEPWAAGDQDVQVHNHFTTDSVTQFLIYRLFAERSYAEDGFVGWDNLIHGGYPIFAHTTPAFNDWSMQLHRFFEFWTAWHLGFIGQLLIAGFGMILFLRGQGMPALVGLLGAVVLLLNTQFVFISHFRFQLAAFAWVPWVLWAMYRYRERTSWAWPLVPVFLALTFLGGTLQSNGYIVVTVVCVWLAWLIESRSHVRQVAVPLTATFAIWGIAGIALAAFALYPNILTFIDNLAAGNVRGGIGYGERPPYLSVFLIPAQLFPTLLGSPRSIDLTRLLNLDFFAVASFGFVPMILALRACFLRDVPRGAQVLLLVGLLLPLTPLVGPLYHRMQIVFVVGGIWAFCWYWQSEHADSLERVFKWIFVLFVAALCAWLAASIATVMFEPHLVALGQQLVASRMVEGQGHFRVFSDWMLERPTILLHELRIWHPQQLIPIATAFACFAALWLRAHRGLRVASVVFLAALMVELGSLAWSWVTFADPEKHPFYEETADISAMRETVGDGRVYLMDSGERPDLFPPNTLSAYNIATIQLYENIRPKSMWQEAGFPTDARGLGRVGVTHAIGYADQEAPGDGWTLAFRGDRIAVWSNDHAMPHYLALASEADSLAEDAAAGIETLPTSGSVEVISASQNRRSLLVPPGTRTLRVAENWSEGWKYRIGDGAWQVAEPGPDLSLMLSLAPSNTPARIELAYDPQRRRMGMWLSLGALVFIALAAWWAAAPRRAGWRDRLRSTNGEDRRNDRLQAA